MQERTEQFLRAPNFLEEPDIFGFGLQVPDELGVGDGVERIETSPVRPRTVQVVIEFIMMWKQRWKRKTVNRERCVKKSFPHLRQQSLGERLTFHAWVGS